jgi:hypothetical protein
METITVSVGTLETLNGGRTQDGRKEVVFEGEKLGSSTVYGYDTKRGNLTDTRGTTETLYRTADGRLVAHVDDWSRWQGEPNTEHLHQVTEDDLRPGGRFEDLGAACGYGRPLTLDEALARMAGTEEA